MASIAQSPLTKTNPIDDSALNEDAFEALFEDTSDTLLRLSIVICGRRELAEDAVQNAWERAWRRRGDLRDAEKAKAWLVSITANEARMLARRGRLRLRIEAIFARDRSDSVQPTDGASIDLRAALARLSADERTLLALRYVAGYTSSEIADITGSAPGVVRVRLSRIHRRLRKDLES
jgi:RNA polymerase sigma-70 factor (ECF subfamily)